MITKIKLEEAIKTQGRKKTWIADQLGVSRPTLDRKLKDNSFTESEKMKLHELQLI